MRGRSNDTIGTLHEGLSVDWQEHSCLCENDTIGTLHEGFLAIGKNRFVSARQQQ